MKKTFAALFALALTSSSALAAEYKIDADHSVVGFKVKHLAISSVPGRFVKFDGKFNFDPSDVKDAKAEAKIDVVSVDTAQSKRDEHLRSPDFFEVVKFPEIQFVSKQVTPGKDKEFKVTGDLTIRGVTKLVTLDVVYDGSAKDLYGNDRAAFSATTKINRKDFGLTWNKVIEAGAVVVGDEVTVNLEIQGIKQS